MGTFHSLRGVKGMLNMFFNFFPKKKKNIILYPIFKLIKYKFFHCLLTQGIVFCTKKFKTDYFYLNFQVYIHLRDNYFPNLNLEYSAIPGLYRPLFCKWLFSSL